MLREKINAEFEKTRSLADGVLFEFGPSRNTDLKFRDLVRRWQPQLGALFVMRIGSLKYRLQAPGFETPESVRLLQAAHDAKSADLVERMANRVEEAGQELASGLDNTPEPFKQSLDKIDGEARRARRDSAKLRPVSKAMTAHVETLKISRRLAVSNPSQANVQTAFGGLLAWSAVLAQACDWWRPG